LKQKPSKRVDTQRLLRAIKPLTDVWAGMPLSYLTTFLLVALEEGQRVGEIARASGMSYADRRTMTRFLRGLSKKPDERNRGIDLLVFRPAQSDPKAGITQKKEAILINKGRELLTNMLVALRD
jgi:hypothetical protein